eukprot:3192069-Alexandrium_andersonii.AAC.1
MAREWSRRMTRYYSLWLDAGRATPFAFSAAELRYEEGADFAKFVSSLTAPLAVRRVQQLRALQPLGNGVC